MRTSLAPLLIRLLCLGALVTACDNKQDGFQALEEQKAIQGKGAADNAGKPILSKIPDVTAFAGDTIAFTLRNERTGSNEGMSFGLTFTVGAGLAGTDAQDWRALPGANDDTFDLATGAFSWTPPAGTEGNFLLRFTGRNANGEDSSHVGVAVQADKRPKLAKILDAQVAVGGTLNVKAVNTNAAAAKPLQFQCFFDKTLDGRVADATPCKNLPGLPAIKFDPADGQLVWQPGTSDAGLYELKIVAGNSQATAEAVFAVNVTDDGSDVIRLTRIRDKSVAAGDTVTFDVNNEVTGNDADVVYACVLDTKIDGQVTGTAPCDILSGTPAQKFNTATGQFSWTPPPGTTGEYELKITGVKQGREATTLVGISFGADTFGDIGNAALTFTPASWDFGAVRVNESSPTKTITIANAASKAIFLDPITIASPHFSVELSSCPTAPVALNAGQSCSVVLKFSPKVASQLGTLFTVKFGKTAGSSQEFSAALGISGTGVGALSFTGLSAITDVTHNKLTLNWPATAAAVSFLLFKVRNTGELEYIETLLNTSGNVTQRTYTGLAPATAYTYRVRATDALGTVDTNTNDITVTTLANRPPVLGSQASINAMAGLLVPSIDFHDSFTGNDTDRDGDAISYTCVYDTTVDGAVSDAETPCTSLASEDGMSPTFNPLTGLFAGWRPRHADVGTSFEIKVSGVDPYAGRGSVIFAVTVTPGAPLITAVGDRKFPASGLVAGESLDFDLNNERASPPSDSGLTYDCQFARYGVTGLSAATACTGLPGTATFNTSTGVFHWQTNATAVGGYRITVSGSNPGGTDTKVINVSVRKPYPRDGALFELTADHADGLGPARTDAGFTGTWTDVAGGGDLTLTGLTAAAWTGNGSATAPRALTFNGTTGRINSGITFTGESELTLETWVQPGNPTDDKQVIWSFGDASGKGWTLTNGAFLQGDGSDPYRSEVLADAPQGYWSFDLVTGTSIPDLSGNGFNGTLSSLPNVAMNVDPPFRTATNRAILMRNNGYMQVPTISLGSQWTIETWFRTPFPTNCGWCTLTRGASTDHQVMIDGNMELGAFDNGGPGFRGSGFRLNTLANGWHHLAVVGKAGTQTYYVDGGNVGSIPWASSSNVYAVGNYQGGGQPFGYMSNFALYPTALSPARITAHKQAAGSRAVCNLGMAKGHWSHVAAHVTSSQLDVYVNGYQQCSLSLAGYPDWRGSTAALRVGASYTSQLKAWAGQLASLRIFNANTADTAANLYGYLKDEHTPNLPIPQRDLFLYVTADYGVYQDLAGTTAAAANSDPVGFWRDFSGYDDNLTASVTTKRATLKAGALGGHNVLSFDGVDDNLFGTRDYGINYSLFYVMQFAGSPHGRCLTSRNNNFLFGTWQNQWDVFYAEGWVRSGGPGAVDNQWVVYSGIHDFTTLQSIYRNGSIVGSGTGGTEGPRGLAVGGWQDGSEVSRCDVASVITYRRALSGPDRMKVEAWLKAQYGL